MSWDLVKTLLASVGSVGGAYAFVQTWLKLRENRKLKQLDAGRADELSAQEQLAAYRAFAERHLISYDVPMRQAVLELRSQLDHEHALRGEPPVQWTPIPELTPLFGPQDPTEKKV